MTPDPPGEFELRSGAGLPRANAAVGVVEKLGCAFTRRLAPMGVDPTGQDLKRYLAEDPGGKVVMLNVLQYRDDGASSYAEYSERIGPHLDRVGGRVLYVGNCSTSLVPPTSGQPV